MYYEYQIVARPAFRPALLVQIIIKTRYAGHSQTVLFVLRCPGEISAKIQ